MILQPQYGSVCARLWRAVGRWMQKEETGTEIKHWDTLTSGKRRLGKRGQRNFSSNCFQIIFFWKLFSNISSDGEFLDLTFGILSCFWKKSCSHSLKHSCHQVHQHLKLEAGLQNLLRLNVPSYLMSSWKVIPSKKIVNFDYGICKQCNIMTFKLQQE